MDNKINELRQLLAQAMCDNLKAVLQNKSWRVKNIAPIGNISNTVGAAAQGYGISIEYANGHKIDISRQLLTGVTITIDGYLSTLANNSLIKGAFESLNICNVDFDNIATSQYAIIVKIGKLSINYLLQKLTHQEPAITVKAKLVCQ